MTAMGELKLRVFWILACFFILVFKTVAREDTSSVSKSYSVIDTPNKSYDGNKIAIKIPGGWGYRTFPGRNGLIGALWPNGTTYHKAKTVIFIFLQSRYNGTPANVNLYEEKCTKSKFKFATEKDNKDPRKSVYEKYFTGPCGSTMVLFEEIIGDWHLICVLASSKESISKIALTNAKEVVNHYKKELEQTIEEKKKNNTNSKN
jgi:hypothetical protein